MEGLENLPQKNNFIVVANHASFLDPLVIKAAIPKKIHCLVLRSLYGIFGLSLFLKLEEALPTGSSSEKAVSLLMQDKIVGLFPEGGRSYDGKLREFKTGAALLALKTGRPIVSCAILGAYDAFPRGANLPKLFPIKVKIAKPIYFLKEFTDVIDDLYLQEGILRVKNTIQEMLNAG